MMESKKLNITKICILTILISMYFILLVRCCDASDMYFMIANGREILKNGILYTNPTSIIELPFVNQQWLYCILLALVDKFGYIGRILFTLFQDVLLLVLANYYLQSKIKDKFIAIVISLFILLPCFYLMTVRPQVITMCLLIAHMIILDKAQDNKKWYLATIPIIILEANLHGALILYHGLIVIPYLLKNHKINWYAFASAISIIPLSFINPYGFNIILYTIKSFTSTAFQYADIPELQSTSPLYPISFVILICMAMFFICSYRHKLNFKVCWYTGIILVCSMHQLRHISIMYLPLLVMSGELCCNLSLSKLTFFQDKDMKKILTVFSSILAIFCIFNCILAYNKYDITKNDSVETTSYLTQYIEDKDAKILSNYANGAYLEYVGFTNVFIDQRPEIYVEKDILKDWYIFMTGIDIVGEKVYTFDEIKNLIDKYDFNYIFASNTSILDRVCKLYSNNYKYIDNDSCYNLYYVIKDS